MTGTASLLETFELAGGRCGRPGADTFTDPAALMLDGVPGSLGHGRSGDRCGRAVAAPGCVSPPQRAPYDLLASGR